MRRIRGAVRGRRSDSGESLALLVVWPALIIAILLMLVHAFIVSNARAEAQAAASEGLRSAWRAAADIDLSRDPDNPAAPYMGVDPHPGTQTMVDAAETAVAQAASTELGWRWWTTGVAEVHSDWCHGNDERTLGQAPGEYRPTVGETGWLRVVVSGEVFGPLAAVWPDRLDTVYAFAQGPAMLIASETRDPELVVPAELPVC